MTHNPEDHRKVVLTERRGHVFIVTLNRPHVRNAMSRAMFEALTDAWVTINEDPDIYVAILTGAGGAFCAGGDLREMSAIQSQDSDKPYLERVQYMLPATLRSYVLTKPLIAAIEGPALAGGAEILQACDIRIAAEGAYFGLPEVTHGLFPLAGSTVRLPRQIPFAKAMEMLLAGVTISAQEAKEFGLIGTLVPDGQALDHALKMAERIASNGPLAVQAIKRSVRATMGRPEEEALKLEYEIGASLWDTQDAKEGMRAFVEKRKPKFVGR